MVDSCIFCKIVRGEIPSYTVYEDSDTLAFLDIHPANPGHTLIIPKRHAENIFEMTHDEWLLLSSVVYKISHAVEKATGSHGLNVKMNNRIHGGQEVMHAHVHVVPRYQADGVVKPIVQKDGYGAGEADAIKERIIASLQ
jgi:histidine triad (HIT) family protein